MIRRTTTGWVLLTLCVWGGAAQADCGAGPQPAFTIPDGHRATEDEMLAAQRNVQHYNDEIRAYAKCLQVRQAGQMADGKDDTGQLRRQYAALTSAAVAQLVSVADSLNQQVIAFKQQCRSDVDCQTNAIARELIEAVSQVAAPVSGGGNRADEKQCGSRCSARY
jgi:hypothetical protein